jgi:thiamine biosynthesis protein ThiS
MSEVSEGDIGIVVNGKARRVPRGATISSILSSLELDRRLVVVELNEEIVRRTELDEVAVREGDRVELVHFVGGG